MQIVGFGHQFCFVVVKEVGENIHCFHDQQLWSVSRYILQSKHVLGEFLLVRKNVRWSILTTHATRTGVFVLGLSLSSDNAQNGTCCLTLGPWHARPCELFYPSLSSKRTKLKKTVVETPTIGQCDHCMGEKQSIHAAKVGSACSCNQQPTCCNTRRGKLIFVQLHLQNYMTGPFHCQWCNPYCELIILFIIGSWSSQQKAR